MGRVDKSDWFGLDSVKWRYTNGSTGTLTDREGEVVLTEGLVRQWWYFLEKDGGGRVALTLADRILRQE